MSKKSNRSFLILGVVVFCLLSATSACTTIVEQNNPPETAEPVGMIKTAVHDPNKVPVASINWGVKISNFTEIFVLSGYGATNAKGEVQFKGDAAAQTQFILERIEEFITSNGYTKDNIIRYISTVTKEVPQEQFAGMRAATSAYFSDMEVKPAAATFRVVQALGNPDMWVELEFWLAK